MLGYFIVIVGFLMPIALSLLFMVGLIGYAIYDMCSSRKAGGF